MDERWAQLKPADETKDEMNQLYELSDTEAYLKLDERSDKGAEAGRAE